MANDGEDELPLCGREAEALEDGLRHFKATLDVGCHFVRTDVGLANVVQGGGQQQEVVSADAVDALL